MLRTEFAVNPATNISVVIPDMSGVSPEVLSGYAADLSRVSDVLGVSTPAGTFVAGELAGPPSAPTGVTEGSVFLTVQSSAPLFTDASNEQLRSLHAVPGPAARPVLFGGAAQYNIDSVESVTSRLPVALGVIAVITFIVLFLVTGSVVLPLKALVLNMLSLTATFGALVWIFQDGHLGGLGTTATGTLVVNIPVLMFCIAFGLSQSNFYEVFVFSRIREYWLASRVAPARTALRVSLSAQPFHRARDHRGSLADVHLVRASDGRRVVHEDVRRRSDDRGVGGRDAGSHAPVARADARARPGELVGPAPLSREHRARHHPMRQARHSARRLVAAMTGGRAGRCRLAAFLRAVINQRRTVGGCGLDLQHRTLRGAGLGCDHAGVTVATTGPAGCSVASARVRRGAVGTRSRRTDCDDNGQHQRQLHLGQYPRPRRCGGRRRTGDTHTADGWTRCPARIVAGRISLDSARIRDGGEEGTAIYRRCRRRKLGCPRCRRLARRRG